MVIPPGSDMYFAAPPTTLLVVLPFAVLPDPLAWWAMMGTTVAGAVATVRVLCLPWWWLLFPPLVIATWVGNPATWLVPLLCSRLAPIAVIAKLSAALPLLMLSRWRDLTVAIVLSLMTLPVLPWSMFIADLPHVAQVLATQAKGGQVPILLLPIAAALVLLISLRERHLGAWLSIAAWPNSQTTYYTQAMPAGALACAFLAVPVPGSPLLALLVCLVGSLVTSGGGNASRSAMHPTDAA